MLLHLGRSTAIRVSSVIAIYDYGIFTQGSNADYLDRQRAAGRVCAIEGQSSEIKSLIITTDRIYLSAISSLTLWRRSRQLPDSWQIQENNGSFI